MCTLVHISVRWPNSEACTIKPPVDLLPNYLDSQWTVSISFGQISMFFHFGHRSSPVWVAALHPRCFLWQSWPKHCRPERAAVQASWVKEKDGWWSKWRDREMLTMRLALCVLEWALLNCCWSCSIQISPLGSNLCYEAKIKLSLTMCVLWNQFSVSV